MTQVIPPLPGEWYHCSMKPGLVIYHRITQALFGWISPLSMRLNMDTARMAACTDCRGCDKTCFMNVIPRGNRRDIS